MTGRSRRLWNSVRQTAVQPVIRNSAALFGSRFSTYFFTLIVIPYLARVLRPQGWGLVVFAQSFAGWLGTILQFGFFLSATGQIAKQRANPDEVAKIVSGVLGAQVLIALLLGAASLVALRSVPIFRDNPVYFWLALVVALGNGFNPMWYFLGMERAHAPAFVDVMSRAIGTAGIFVWVALPGEGWRALTIQAFETTFATGILLALLYWEVPLRLPQLTSVWQMLHTGWSMFVFRTATNLYTLTNTLVLGLFVPPALVGFFGGAERITMAIVGLLGPISSALYPRTSYLVSSDRSRAAVLVRRSCYLLAAIGAILAALLLASAPLLVRVVFGPGFEPAVPLLQILAMIVPIISLSTVFGTLWIVPLGMDRALNTIVIGAGLLNLIMGPALAYALGPTGMALAVVTVQSSVTIGMVCYLVSRGEWLWSWQPLRLATVKK